MKGQTPVPRNCYSSWEDLKRDIQSAEEADPTAGGVFEVCPGTIFNLALFLAPIAINGNNIVIRCGPNGSQKNDCSVVGGENHFILGGSGSGIRFLGMRFESAFRTAVIAGGDVDGDVTFDDCGWEGNGGDASLIISEPLGGQGMTVNVIGCSFDRNANIDSIIQNIRGTLILRRTIFSNNTAKYGTVSVSNGGSISFANTCFVGNGGSSGIGPSGTVVIDGNSILALNDRNYGEENTVDSSCRDIFFSSSGECEVFSGTECIETSTVMPNTIETLSPTYAPLEPSTPFPSSNPTAKPSRQKTLQPTSSPVELATASPTSAPSNTISTLSVTPTTSPSKYTILTPTFSPIDRTSFPSNDFKSIMPIYLLSAHPTTLPKTIGSSTSSKAGKLFKSYNKSKAGKSSHMPSYLASEGSRKSVKSGKKYSLQTPSNSVQAPSTPSFLPSSASRKSAKSGKLLSSENSFKIPGDPSYLASNASRKSEKSGKLLLSSKSRKAIAIKSGKKLFKSKASTTKGIQSQEPQFV